MIIIPCKEKLREENVMGDIVQFDGGIDPQKQELLDYLAELRREIAQLDENEPEEQESEQFEIWSDMHEDLEDSVDEIMDILDSMK